MNKIRVYKIEVDSLLKDKMPGEVVFHRLTDKETGTEGISITVVSFPPGVKRPWSVHDQDQYLWILQGKGIIASEEEEIIVEPGTAIFVPAGLKHWHGAVDGSPYTQLSIIGGTKT